MPSLGRVVRNAFPVAVRSPDLALDAGLEAYIQQRIGSKLGKFSSHLGRVSVRFEQASGFKGAPTIVCKIKTVVPHLGSVVVEAHHADKRAAFDEAADAHERAVRRLLDRQGRTDKPTRR
jgi:ribosome-associated translation inhibitor RaiA